MFDIDGDDTLSITTATADSASQPSSHATNSSIAGGGVFSALRKSRSIAEQLQEIDNDNLPSEVSQLPKIWIANEPFVCELWAAKKRKKRSPVDQYGIRLTKLDKNHNKRGEYWLYSICDQKNKTALYAIVDGSTSSAFKHCRKDHKLLMPETGSEASEVADSEPPRRRQKTLFEMAKGAAEQKFIPKPLAESFRALMLTWIADADVPFTAIEHPAFRQLLSLLNEHLITELLPQSGDTIKAWMKTEFEEQKAQLKNQLALSPYKKHLTFDLWTSPNSYALLGIVAHFADAFGEVQTELLGLKRVIGSHSGENIAPILLGVIEEYGLSDTIGYFTCDNADSNDRAIEELYRALLPEEDSAALARRRRLRCANHTLNLTATAFFEGKLKDVLREWICVQKAIKTSSASLSSLIIGG